MLREYSEHTFYILDWEQLVKAQQYLRDYVFSVPSYISGQEIESLSFIFDWMMYCI